MPARKIRGVWYVDVRIDVPGEGRQRFRKRSPFQTKKGTEKFEREFVEDVCLILNEPEERSFEDYAKDFLKTYAVANNKHSEVVTKESILRVHLIPAFGQYQLEEIGPAVIERYKAAKLSNGLKPKTINNHLAVLRKALIVAMEWGLLQAAPKVKQMKVAPPDFDFLDHEEADRLVAAADGDFQVMIITGCKTGLRLGEMRALRWEDVDLTARRLMVRRSVSRGRIGTPKSNRVRELPLCATVITALKAHRHLRGELVFCQDDGRMFTRSETYGGLQRACRLAGLRRIGWHTLRHYPAPRIIPPQLSAREGQSDVRRERPLEHAG